MKYLSALISITTLTAILSTALAVSVHATPVIINEIHYHPLSEDVREEYIELLNTSATTVNLTDWRFSDGIEYTFPDITLQPGGLLLVAADLTTFTSNHPGVMNVVGNWAGQLSNSGEDINLEDAFGDRVDRVRYADRGDWADRKTGELDHDHRGWTWHALHDGEGMSLELINPLLSNNHGQNWKSSLVTNGTPGTINSVLQTDVAPLVLDVQHLPAIPRSVDDVLVTARLVDELSSNMTASVYWRVDGTSSFTAVPMYDDGLHDDGSSADGVFAATIPAQMVDTVVEFYVEAVDAGLRSRTWPAPAFDENGASLGQAANALYQVDDSVYEGSMPIYKLIMTEIERAELDAIGHGSSAESKSHAQMNGSFISVDGSGTEVRYALGIRNRGSGSRRKQPNSYKVNFRSDQRWKGIKTINLNGQYSHAQIIGSVLTLKSDLPTGESRPVQVRVNNANLGDNGPKTYGGAYAANESVGSDLLDHWIPDDSSGNAYKADHLTAPKEFNYRGDEPDAYSNTYFKATNESEDDWTDLIGMLRIMGTNDLLTAEAIKSVVDVEQWMTYFATMALLNNHETSPNLGANDDYYLYFGVNDPRCILIPHDFDTIIGNGDTYGSPTNTIFGAFGVPVGSASKDTFDVGFLLTYPEFEQIYYRVMQDLLDTTFSKVEFDTTLDQTLNSFVPAETIETMKSWMDTRRDYVQGIIAPYLAGLTHAPVAAIAGEPRSPTALSSAILSVSGEGVVQYRYALNDGAFGTVAPVTTPITLNGLPEGTNYVRVIGADTNNVWQAEADATASGLWLVNTAWPAVRINEVIAENLTAFNHSGTFPDAIELYNEGVSTVNLAGMRLSDKLGSPDKFFFPAGTTLAPGGYLVVLANDSDGTPGFHTGFSLKQSGEGVFLFDTVEAGSTLLDSVKFGLQLPDHSIGRDSGGAFVLCQPSFGTVNTAQPLAEENALRINEWLTRGFSLIPDDFIEIYNPGVLPAALGGLYLTDNPVGDKTRHRITPHTFLGAGDLLAFISDGDADEGADHVGFKLASEQGMIALISSGLKTIDCVAYGPQNTDVSQGRVPDGGAAVEFFAQPSPGAPNPFSVAGIQVETLVEMTNSWSYNQTENLDGAAWTEMAFNDGAWPEGRALLYVETSSLPASTNTPLTLGRSTYYFRTHFNFSGDPASAVVQISTILDDGCVIHINGIPVLWMGFDQDEAPAYADLSDRTVGNAELEGPFSVPGTVLEQGDNIIAVEVHQTAASSSDVVMGLELDVLTSGGGPAVVLNEVLAANRSYTNESARAPDWVEIMNTGTASVNLGDMSLSDDPSDARKWVFPAGSVLEGGGRLVIEFDNTLPASPTNTGFALAADGDSVLLYANLADGGVLINSLAFGLQIDDFSLSRIPDGWGEWTLSLPTRANGNVSAGTGIESQLRINEWMANPASGDDWFELYNPNPQPVALGDLALTDNPSNRSKSPFLPLSFIAPNGFLKLIADDNSSAGGDHVRFGLSADGDFIALYRSVGTQVDGVSFGPQTTGASEGRFLDGAANIAAFPTTASPGAENYLPLSNIVINELLTHTDPPLEDAVEILNLGDTPVDLGGWYLSDSAKNPRKFLIPAGSILDADGYTVIYENQFITTGQPGVNEPFSFNSAHGGEVYLSQTDANTNMTGYRANAVFGAAANGQSFGRHVTSIGQEFVIMSTRTFGEDTPASLTQFRTGTGAPNSEPLVGPIIFSEIHSQPTNAYGGTDFKTGEFIELRNLSASPVPLYDPSATTNTWQLDGGVSFSFPMNTSIPSTGSVIVVGFNPDVDTARAEWFASTYSVPPGLQLVGPWSGALADEGESLELYRPDSPQLPPNPDAGFVPQILVEQVVYQPFDPWPELDMESDDSLQRRVPDGFGNEPLNWFTALPSSGTDNLADSDGDLMPDYWELENGLNPYSSNGVNGANGNLDGDVMSNLQEWEAGTAANDSQDYFRILSFTLTADGVNVLFVRAPGRRYNLLTRNTLTSGTWEPLVVAPLTANKDLMELYVPRSTNDTVHYYRLEITPEILP